MAHTAPTTKKVPPLSVAAPPTTIAERAALAARNAKRATTADFARVSFPGSVPRTHRRRPIRQETGGLTGNMDRPFEDLAFGVDDDPLVPQDGEDVGRDEG